jgi:hypothetical protein
MTAFGKANYERYRDFNHGVSAVTGEPLPEWDDMPLHIKSGWSAGAEAVALVLAECPVDEDAPGIEPAKVIVVTEANVVARTADRRYLADRHERDGDYLLIWRDGRIVGEYAAGRWASARHADSEVPDGTARALGIAKRALQAIRELYATDKRDTPDVAADIDICAEQALADIWNETEG